MLKKGIKKMNNVILMGRLTKDPDIRYTQTDEPMCIARYTLAVDRKYKREGEPSADFINCVAFGKTAEFAEKYYHKGIKIAITGRIQTGSYENKEGQRVYTTDIVVESQEFCESKNANSEPKAEPLYKTDDYDGFKNLDEIDELPF